MGRQKPNKPRRERSILREVVSMPREASDILNSMDGASIPGGCDHCNAVQKITANMHGPGIHGMGVYHDDDCPFLNSLPN